MGQPFRCPKCGERLRVEYLGNGNWEFECTSCDFKDEIVIDPDKDARFAYSALIEKHRENIPEDVSRTVLPLYRTFDEIKRLIESQGISFEELPDVIKNILQNKAYLLVKYKLFREEKGEFGPSISDLPLSDELKEYLKHQGITKLFTFQYEAIQKILSGHDVVIVAPTGNGKTEAFLLPIAQRIIESSQKWGPLRDFKKSVQAIFIYPTKALARDQLQKFKKLEAFTGLSFAVFDGDTPQSERKKILENPPDVLITNPDILHYHLLRRSKYRRLFLTAKYVVLDEIHQYTGAFGTNVHFVLRRLERLAGKFQLIGASATIGNPDEFGKMLFNRDVKTVICKHGRRGRLHFLMLYPVERSTSTMIAEIVSLLVKSNYKTLSFANSHKMAEIINLLIRKMGIKSAVHRAGLTEEVRHKIEDDFKRNRLRALVATPTLELGIDIGDLDSVVSMIIGFSRLVQRIGRAGRKGQESIAILALRNDDPISNYYRQRPDDYFSDIDPAYIEIHNEVIGYYQLLAAAMDKVMKKDEFREFVSIIDRLLKDRLLFETGNVLTPNRKKAMRILLDYNIRGIGDTVDIYEGKKRIGERAMPMAARELHPGAVYLHGGVLYESVEFHFERESRGYAILKRLPESYAYKTTPLRTTQPEILEVLDRKIVYGLEVLYCKLKITEIVQGYTISEIMSDKTIEIRMLDEPIYYTFETVGFVFSVPSPEKSVEEYITSPNLPEGLEDESDLIGGAFHAVEHVLIESSGMLTGGGSSEIGGISMGTSGIIFVYDGIPGGSGLSKLLYNKLDVAFQRALRVLEGCTCKRIDGCPACTYSYQCGNNNRPLFKIGAIEVLKKVTQKVKAVVDVKNYNIYKPIV